MADAVTNFRVTDQQVAPAASTDNTLRLSFHYLSFRRIDHGVCNGFLAAAPECRPDIIIITHRGYRSITALRPGIYILAAVTKNNARRKFPEESESIGRSPGHWAIHSGSWKYRFSDSGENFRTHMMKCDYYALNCLSRKYGN